MWYVWQLLEDAREERKLGQAGTLAFSNCYRERKNINREKGDTEALASYFLPRLEEQPSKLLNKLKLIKTS